MPIFWKMMDPASVQLLTSVFHADFAWAPMGKSVQGAMGHGVSKQQSSLVKKRITVPQKKKNEM
jgi:hypothetical protein